MGAFSNAEIDVPCPKCGTKIRRSIDFLTSHKGMDCPSCKATIRLDADELRRGIKDADSKLDELKRTLRKFGR